MKKPIHEKVIDILFKICKDKENKMTDRISASKLLLEYSDSDDNQDSEVRVVFDGADNDELE